MSLKSPPKIRVPQMKPRVILLPLSKSGVAAPNEQSGINTFA